MLPLCVSAAEPFRATAQDSIVPRDAKLELVWCDGEFTEGPARAADGSILFSDIGNRILRYDPASGQTTVFRDPSGRSNGLMFDAAGRLVACEGANTGGGRRISVTFADGQVKTLSSGYQGKKFNSPNDLAITKSGRVYFSDPRYVGDDPRELDFEGVFLVEPDGTTKLATKALQKPNGVIIAPDEKSIYIADNNNDPQGNHHLVKFSFAADGTLVDPVILFDFGPDKRGIDGMTIDSEGNIYATAGRGAEAGIYVFAPAGKQLAFIATPGDPTNCVFAGEDLRTLYITAQGAQPRDPNQPRKFGLYRIGLLKRG